MAKKTTATALKAEVPVNSQELAGFLDIITVNKLLEPAKKEVLYDVAVAFLRSLDMRESRAKEMVAEVAEDPELKILINPVSKRVLIRSKEDADLAANVANRIAAVKEQVSALCEKETSFFNKFHKTLTGRRKPHVDTLDGFINMLKEGSRMWLLAEQRREAERVAAANQEIQKEYVNAGLSAQEAPVVSPEAPKISGMSGFTIYDYAVPDFMALVKAVSRGKVPLSALQVNDEWMTLEVRKDHALAVKGDGDSVPSDKGNYLGTLHEGCVQVFEDLSMRRR